MNSAIFLYNIGLIVLYTIASMGYVMLYIRTHRKIHLIVALLFFLFLLDNTIVYMAEFLNSFSDFYTKSLANGSIYKMLLLSAIGLCYLFVKCSIVNEERLERTDLIAYGIYILEMAVMPQLTFFSGNIWFFYAGESILVIYLCITAIQKLKDINNEEGIKRYHKYKYFLIIIMVLGILIIAEDAVVLFGMESLLAMSSRIRQRNLFEDILSIFYAGYACYIFVQVIQEKNKEEVLKETISQEAVPKLVPYHPISEIDLKTFSEEYSLTKREQQVLKLLLEDKTNQEMQELLVIALGTVKNHIHNIYQKTNVSKRSQLLMLVNEFYMEQNENEEDI